MIKNTKISIVIPYYNAEKYIERALKSAVNQTLEEIEIICINNASTDNSEAKVKMFAEQDDRIVMVSNSENRGISYSRNKGIDLASGEYLFYLDADDELILNAMEETYDAAKQEDLDILFFEADLRYENHDLKSEFNQPFQIRNIGENYVMTGLSMFELQLKHGIYKPALWKRLFSAKFLKKNRFRFIENILHEDIPFLFQSLVDAQKVMYNKRKYYIRYRREGSLTTAEDRAQGLKGKIIGYGSMLRTWEKCMDADINEQRAIATYLSSTYRIIKSDYGDIDYDDRPRFEHPFYEHLCDCVLMNKSLFTTDQLKIIRKYEHVIIYGAGRMGTEVLKELDNCKIEGFAVTEMGDNLVEKAGYPVYKIEDYQGNAKDNTIIIIAVTKKNSKGIEKHLREMGYTHILAV